MAASSADSPAHSPDALRQRLHFFDRVSFRFAHAYLVAFNRLLLIAHKPEASARGNGLRLSVFLNQSNTAGRGAHDS